MRPYEFPDFQAAIEQAQVQLQFRSKVVHSARWQGSDIASRPEMATHELAHVSFCVDMGKMKVPSACVGATLGTLQEQIKPNLPWADNHFDERVSGTPMNPGTEWRNWPYNKSAERFLDERGKFNHNYMERYWPKHAGMVPGATVDAQDWRQRALQSMDIHEPPHRGIMYGYGDLNDVVKLLAEDPYTRQAYLPVWFPEDTGGGSKRAPCTIGYHFLMRDGKLDTTYQIRSCDFIRHFRDDIYLTVRLQLWVIEQVRKINPDWNDVTLGKFIMSIQSLHLFRNDYTMLFKGHSAS